MRRISNSRFFRILVCLVLIWCFLVNFSPIKAEASVAGTVIASASLVSVPVAVWAAAALIAIGVTVDWVADPNYNSFDALVDNVSTFLTDAGSYVKDGMVDMIRVVDETGKAVYYAAGDALESVRSWLFDSEIVSSKELILNPSFSISAEALSKAESAAYSVLVYYTFNGSVRDYHLAYSNNSSIYVKAVYDNGTGIQVGTKKSNAGIYSWNESSSTWVYNASISFAGNANYVISSAQFFGSESPVEFVSSYDVGLGVLPSVPIDGTGAREWSEEYTNNGLYIVGTGGSGNNNPNDGKWFWPLAFGVTTATLYAMSQADQWAGETSSEFSDYEVKEDYSVSPGQEVEFGQSVELTPDPSANPDPGTGTNPDPGTNPDVDPNPGTNSGSSSWTPPSDMGKFTLDLKQYFPFCIPFDLYAFFTCLNAEPVAPVIEWIIPLPGGKTYPFEIDLSAFDSVAQILRRMQLLLFCVGLAFKTRDLIKG